MDYENYSKKSEDEIFKKLKTSEKGLKQEEVIKRRIKNNENNCWIGKPWRKI